MRSEVYRNTIPQKFTDPATLKMVNTDLAMYQVYNDIIIKLEFQIEDNMEVQDPVSNSIINSVPGLGFILSFTILYEIDDIHRFSDVGKFISYCRLVKCSHESAGKKEKGGHNKIGNYRHRMMTILFLLQAWHGYRFTFTQGRLAFLADAASLASFSPKMSLCRKSVFRFAVTDYMCLIQDAFPGIFF